MVSPAFHPAFPKTFVDEAASGHARLAARLSCWPGARLSGRVNSARRSYTQCPSTSAPWNERDVFSRSRRTNTDNSPSRNPIRTTMELRIRTLQLQNRRSSSKSHVGGRASSKKTKILGWMTKWCLSSEQNAVLPLTCQSVASA
jgi:hypothetical protein